MWLKALTLLSSCWTHAVDSTVIGLAKICPCLLGITLNAVLRLSILS